MLTVCELHMQELNKLRVFFKNNIIKNFEELDTNPKKRKM